MHAEDCQHTHDLDLWQGPFMAGARSLTGEPSRARRLRHALRRGLRAALPPKRDEHSDTKLEHTKELFLASSKLPKLHFKLE